MHSVISLKAVRGEVVSLAQHHDLSFALPVYRRDLLWCFYRPCVRCFPQWMIHVLNNCLRDVLGTSQRQVCLYAWHNVYSSKSPDDADF